MPWSMKGESVSISPRFVQKRVQKAVKNRMAKTIRKQKRKANDYVVWRDFERKKGLGLKYIYSPKASSRRKWNEAELEKKLRTQLEMKMLGGRTRHEKEENKRKKDNYGKPNCLLVYLSQCVSLFSSFPPPTSFHFLSSFLHRLNRFLHRLRFVNSCWERGEKYVSGRLCKISVTCNPSVI